MFLPPGVLTPEGGEYETPPLLQYMRCD